MHREIESVLSGFYGRVSFYAQNVATGASCGQAENRRLQTASTIKAPIMAAVHAEVASGRADWNERLALTSESRAYGAGVLPEVDDGLQLTLKDAVHLMIVVSDNTATNMVLNRISADCVNDRLDEFGLSEIRSLRCIGGGGECRAASLPENAGFGIGVATSRDMVRFLVMLAQGRIVSPASSSEMISVLGRQRYHYGLGRAQAGDGVQNKPGALDRLRSDIGMALGPNGPIAIAITCDELPDVNWSVDSPAYLLISRLSDTLVDVLS